MGILLFIVSNIFSTKENVTSQIEHETYSKKKDEDIEEVSLIANVNEIEENYENQLQVMLNEVIGLSEVEVMINIDSTRSEERRVGKECISKRTKSQYKKK